MVVNTAVQYVAGTPKGILPPVLDPSVLNGRTLLDAILARAEADQEHLAY